MAGLRALGFEMPTNSASPGHGPDWYHVQERPDRPIDNVRELLLDARGREAPDSSPEALTELWHTIQALAVVAGLSHEELLRRLGFAVGAPGPSLPATNHDPARTCAFLRTALRLLDRVDLRADRGEILNELPRLLGIAGGDIKELETAMASSPPGGWGALDYLELGELRQAFEATRESLRGRRTGALANPYGGNGAHLSLARLSLLRDERDDLLGDHVARRMRNHVAICDWCSAEFEMLDRRRLTA